LEQSRLDRFGNTRAVVLDDQFDMDAVDARANLDCRVAASRAGDRRVVRDTVTTSCSALRSISTVMSPAR